MATAITRRSKKVGLKNLPKQAITPLTVIGGFGGAAVLDRMALSKLIKGTDTVSKFGKPTVIAVASLIGSQKVKNKMLKDALIGSAGYGLADLIRKAFNIDITDPQFNNAGGDPVAGFVPMGYIPPALPNFTNEEIADYEPAVAGFENDFKYGKIL